MNSVREKQFALGVLLLALVANAAALSAELSIGRVTGNDNVLHLALVKGMAGAIESGRNPLDFWSTAGAFGAPVLRTYQPLAHALVTAVYFAFGKTVSLVTVFIWVRFLALVLLPLGFYAAASLFELPPLAAAAAALLAPLISTDNLYGLEANSYVATGRGLFPQSLAALLLLFALGYGYRALRYGRQWMLAGLLLGLTAACHFIYGWVGAVTLCLLALLPEPATSLWLRLRRTLAVGSAALAVAAFQIVPVLLDAPFLNHSRWEESWKWDSFGAAFVLKNLFTGELLDHGRLPVLTLLASAGTAVLLWDFWKTRRLQANQRFVLAAALLWLLLFFGRPVWGPLLLLLGVSPDLHLHRTIGALQLFLVLLAAIALETGWRSLARRGLAAVALVAALLLFAPMLVERGRYLARNEAVATEVTIAVDTAQQKTDTLIAAVTQSGGRTYAGTGLGWGPRFQIANIPFFAFLTTNLVPSASPAYHLLALPADILPLFDETRAAHYRLFNVHSVVAPANVAPAEVAPKLPTFLSLRGTVGRDSLLDAPGGGYFDLVDVAAAVPTNKTTFYSVNERWLHSDWVENHAHLLLDFGSGAPAGIPRLRAQVPLPAAPPPASPVGEIQNQRQNGEEYEARFAVARPGYALFKMTWHPNWVARLDGKIQPTVMLSPGFLGVPVATGSHTLVLSYEPGNWKWILALAGLLLACAGVFAERHRALAFLDPMLRPALPAAAEPEPPALNTSTAPSRTARGRR